MSWPILTYQHRAMLYNALRDVEEVAYDVAETIRPEWKRVEAGVEIIDGDKVVLKIDEVPTYLNIVDALLMIRDLLKLILEMDNKEKVMAIDRRWK